MNKKIIIAGGTGMIGSRLAVILAGMDYEVIILSRTSAGRPINDSKNRNTKNKNIFYAKWTGDDNGWKKHIDNSYAVINFSGASIGAGRWTKAYKKVLINSRLDSTGRLVEAIKEAKNPPEVFISTSAVGYYGNTGDKELNEDSQPSDDFLARLCVDWESKAKEAETVCRIVTPRLGAVLSSSGGALKRMLLPFKLGLGGPIGTGMQWFPWIHIGDVINLYVWLLENTEVPGTVNAVSPGIVRQKDFARVFGNVLKRPAFLPLPGLMLKAMMGEAASLATDGQKAVPEKLIAFGFDFAYPDLQKALRDLLK